MPKDYSGTLNLPSTTFSMRANLPQREPDTLTYWDSIDLYHKMLEQSKDKPLFVIHDGPPFSNGNIHMGTAMNKILKDFINKSKHMMGYHVPYIPGWDNHGMPIESAIIKKNKIDRKKMSIPEFRDACHTFAQNFVDTQRRQFIRLGVLADWENPYLTMSREFEAREVKVFGEMYRKGYIYKGLKPVYWCPHDETALAEAEIEYKDIACRSVYVKFRVKDDLGKLADVCDLAKTYFIIWTTTTWTLPGNLAIALSPVEQYAITKACDGNYYITAEPLVAKTMKAGGIDSYEIIKTLRGDAFEYMKAQHPFLERDSLLVNADYVTMDSGTGCVHTAPGFGADDYLTCRRYQMEMIVPVDDKGYQTDDAGPFAGMYYEESNDAIFNRMKEDGSLFASEDILHQYPHCWRCKNPIIFRATPQWFCSVEAFKDEATRACDDVQWQPAWGKDRMVSMIKERADWCISRQRHWGLPIPVVYCEDCGKPVCTPETIDAISALFAAEGSNAWFLREVEQFLPAGLACPHCGGKHFRKETDTLDGWFDSGSTHFNVLENKPGIQWPADLYLEGADQYRGWFQSSLLTAVGAKGQGAPYRSILTHGWVVDGEGRAMHKSLGNSIAPEEVIVKYGADLVRLWVASSDYQVDVRVSDPIFKQLSETYRKIRNTSRILLANLGSPETDFDPNRDMLPVKDLYEIDKWALSSFNRLVATCRQAYSDYQFHVVYHEVNKFCTIVLSKLYIDITKDRVYVMRKDAAGRRSAQTAMFLILSGLTRLIAPMLSFTAEEIWKAMPHLASENSESVFLNLMPDYTENYAFEELEARWNSLFALRDDVMKALEEARNAKKIGKSLDAAITLYATDAAIYRTLTDFADELATVFIVSKVTVLHEAAPSDAFTDTESGIAVQVEPADGCKCDRCWAYTTDCTPDGDGFLCARCRKIVESL